MLVGLSNCREMLGDLERRIGLGRQGPRSDEDIGLNRCIVYPEIGLRMMSFQTSHVLHMTI